MEQQPTVGRLQFKGFLATTHMNFLTMNDKWIFDNRVAILETKNYAVVKQDQELSCFYIA